MELLSRREADLERRAMLPRPPGRTTTGLTVAEAQAAQLEALSKLAPPREPIGTHPLIPRNTLPRGQVVESERREAVSRF